MTILDAKNVQKEIIIPDDYNEDERLIIAEKCIDLIKERTRSGLDESGRAFKYVKDSKFAENNIELSGDTLLSIELISQGTGYVTIGFSEPNSIEGNRAEGNILGSYGGKPDASKAKPFLGISGKELSLILSEIDSNRVNGELDETSQIANSIFARLFGG